MKKNCIENCSEVERYKKMSLSVEEMAKIRVILDEFKKLKQGGKVQLEDREAQLEDREVQPHCEQIRNEDEDLLLYAYLCQKNAGGNLFQEVKEENARNALCEEKEIPSVLSQKEIACARKIIGEFKQEDVEKELNLLEEFLLLERKKTRREDLPETERKVAEERENSIIKVMKIVNAEKHILTNDDRKNLALIAERLLEDTASAHVREDADDKIEVMVYDSIYRKPLATLEIKKVCDCLDFQSFHFYE